MIVHVDKAEEGLIMAYKKGVRQEGDILINQRNNGNFAITGFAELEAKMDQMQNVKLGERLLNAAEPHIITAMDTQMLRHKGPLQKSLKSTGAVQNSAGGWFLAYRATTGNENPGDKSNPDKMIYLINREYIRIRGGKVYKRMYKGKEVIGYAIPAYDVITQAIAASENAVLNAMENEFDRALSEIWGDDE